VKSEKIKGQRFLGIQVSLNPKRDAQIGRFNTPNSEIPTFV
jgi:hypothetical protein